MQTCQEYFQDKEALTDAMKRLVYDKALSDSISSEAERIRKQYSVTAIAQMWLEIIAEV